MPLPATLTRCSEFFGFMRATPSTSGRLIPNWTEYELLDAGNRRKLERFGEYMLVRPEPQADWRPSLPEEKWDAAHAEFIKPDAQKKSVGEWKFRHSTPPRWIVERGTLKFWVQPAPSGHVGVFPDQACHWDWITDAIDSAARPVKMLSLFGHTGLASLAAASAGAEVTHVDASRKAVALARENQALSDLREHPIRWIVDDAPAFVRREARRKHSYDALLLDPPRFGRGPGGEIWKLEDSLPELLEACAGLLSDSPMFVLLNVYVTVLTESRVRNEAGELCGHLQRALRDSHPTITGGELAIADANERKIRVSVFARAVF